MLIRKCEQDGGRRNFALRGGGGDHPGAGGDDAGGRGLGIGGIACRDDVDGIAVL